MIGRLRRGFVTAGIASVLVFAVPVGSASADLAPIPWSSLATQVATRQAAAEAATVILPRAAAVVDAAPCAGWTCALKILSWGFTAWGAYKMYDTWNTADEPTTGGPAAPAPTYPAAGGAGGNTTPTGSAGLYAWGVSPGNGAPAINMSTGINLLKVRWNPVKSGTPFDFGRAVTQNAVGYWVKGFSTRFTTVADLQGYPMDTIAASSADADTGCGLGRVACQSMFMLISSALLSQAKTATGKSTVVTGDIYVDWLATSISAVNSVSGDACVGCTLSWQGAAPTAAQLGVALPSADVTYSATVECRRADGTKFVLQGPGIGRDASGLLGAVVIPSCAEAEAGAANWDVAVNRNWGGTVTPLAHSSVNETWLGQNAPDCLNRACTLDWYLDGTPCTVGRAGCTTTQLADLQRAGSTRLACVYGGYGIASAECVRLNTAYMTPAAPAVTPTQTPVPQGDPQPEPTPTPTATAPAGTEGLPVPAPLPRPQDYEENACWPTGWGIFNPASWVLKPVKCALTWAFVPKTATLATLSATASDDLTRVGIAPIAGAVNANFAKLGSSSGCDGPPVTFSAVGIVKPMHPFSACAAPMSTVAGISYAVTSVVVVLGGGWAALVAIGAGFGFNMSLGRTKEMGA